MRMNPVYKNELKMSARSMQLPVLAVIFNSILSVVALIALYGIRQNYITRCGVRPVPSSNAINTYFIDGLLATSMLAILPSS